MLLDHEMLGVGVGGKEALGGVGGKAGGTGRTVCKCTRESLHVLSGYVVLLNCVTAYIGLFYPAVVARSVAALVSCLNLLKIMLLYLRHLNAHLIRLNAQHLEKDVIADDVFRLSQRKNL